MVIRAEYSRAALLAWLRNVVPDLRFGRAVDDGTGERQAFALFTFRGEVHELEAIGENADDQIVHDVAEVLRAAIGIPQLGRDRHADSRELETDIVKASLAGRHDEADALTRKLLLGPPQRAATLLGARTQFSKRQVW